MSPEKTPAHTMTPEQIERNRAFLADLRANPKKAQVCMRDAEGGRCCLCVAYDTAQRLGANLAPVDDADPVPPKDIANFYGWDDPNPDLQWIGQPHAAAALNDIGWSDKSQAGVSHAQIADAFEATFPQLATARTPET